MGGTFHTTQGTINRELKEIINGESNYIVKLTLLHTEKSIINTAEGKPANHYRTYNEINEEEIRTNAQETSKFYGTKLSKIEIFTIKTEPLKELSL